MKMNDVINIIYHFNDKYAPYAGVSITSLFENNKHISNIRVFAVCEDVSENNIKKFKLLGKKYNRSVVIIETEELVHFMKKLGLPDYRGSYAANMRMFLSLIIPDDVERLIYLDSDTIVVGDILKLWNTDIGHSAIGMVMDSLSNAHKKELRIKGRYYNSGVILYQMDLWKELRMEEKLQYHIKENRSCYAMPDQDLLNVVCKESIYPLLPKFNYQPIHRIANWHQYEFYYHDKYYYSKDEIQDAKDDPVIIHFFRFIGEFPWNEGNIHPDNDLYDKYLEISPWKNTKKTYETLSGLFKIEKIMYRFFPRGLFLLMFKVAHTLMMYVSNRKSLIKSKK